jgi:hypothetical protein
MTSFADLRVERPDLAEAVVRILRPDGATSAYLATVRADGGPRIHPVMPVLAGGSLYAFIVSMSWKYRDLLRDGRYSLHSSDLSSEGEEIYLTGAAHPVASEDTRAFVRGACENRLGNHEFEALFELDIERVLHTHWENWGASTAWPTYEKWPDRLV